MNLRSNKLLGWMLIIGAICANLLIITISEWLKLINCDKFGSLCLTINLTAGIWIIAPIILSIASFFYFCKSLKNDNDNIVYGVDNIFGILLSIIISFISFIFLLAGSGW